MNKLLNLFVVLCVCTVVYTQSTLHLQGESTSYISNTFKKVDKTNTHLFCIATSSAPKDDLKYTASLDVSIEDEPLGDYLIQTFNVKFSWQQNDETTSIPFGGRTSVNVELRNKEGALFNGWQEDEFKAKGVIFGYLSLPKTATPKMIVFNVADSVGPSGFNKIDGSIETCKQLLTIPATDIDNTDDTDNNDDTNTNNKPKTHITSVISYYKWFIIGGAALLAIIIVSAIRRCIVGCRQRRAACRNYQEMQHVHVKSSDDVVDPIATTTAPATTPFSYFMAPQSANGMAPMYLQPTSSEGQQPMQVMFVPQQHFQQFQEQFNQQKN